MALWRPAEAVFAAAGPDGGAARKRPAGAARAVFYGVVAYSVPSFATGEQGSGSSDRQPKDVTARALDLPYGRWLVAAAGGGGRDGAAVAVAGAWIAVRAIRCGFHKHLKVGAMSRRTRRAVEALGSCGGVARGAVFAVARWRRV